MNIISNYKDYYDSIGQQYSDPNDIIWERKEHEIKLTPKIEKYLESLKIQFPFSHENYFYLFDDKKSIGYKANEVIIFCGKCYFLLNKIFFKETNDKAKFIIKCFWNEIPEINKRLINKHTKRCLDFYKNIIKLNKNKSFLELHRELESPIIRVNARDFYYQRITVNPSLRELKFASALDPYMAYQELDMFISNFLSKPKEIIKISDKDKLEKHGFNDMSFKKEKEIKNK